MRKVLRFGVIAVAIAVITSVPETRAHHSHASLNPDEVFDGHLRSANFFDTENYPEITFVSTGIKAREDNKFELMGDLTIKSNTLPFTLDAVLQKADFHPMRELPTIGVTAETTVSRSAFGMPLGTPSISDEVTIYISVEMPKKTEE